MLIYCFTHYAHNMKNNEKGESGIELIFGLFVAIIMIWAFSQALSQISFGYAVLFVVLSVLALGLSIARR